MYFFKISCLLVALCENIGLQHVFTYSAEISAASWPHAIEDRDPPSLPGGHIQVCKLLELYISWHLPLQDFCPQTKLSPTMWGIMVPTQVTLAPFLTGSPLPPMVAPPSTPSPPPPNLPKALAHCKQIESSDQVSERVLTPCNLDRRGGGGARVGSRVQ
jgi:hypothetical protein